jgi:hypothetical protein
MEDQTNPQLEDQNQLEITPEMVESAANQIHPSLVDKLATRLGYVPKEQFEATQKQAMDNQQAFRKDHQVYSDRLAGLESLINDLLTKNQQAPQADENLLYRKWQESGETADFVAYQSAHDANLVNNITGTLEKKFGDQTRQIQQNINAQQYGAQFTEVLSRPEFKGITRDQIEEHFTANPNPTPEETAFVYLAREAIRTGKAKDLNSFVKGFSNPANRQVAPGATLPGAGSGQSRLNKFSNVDTTTMSPEQYEQYRKTIPQFQR